MKTPLSRRLRVPLVFAVLALVVVVIGGATYGWSSVPNAIPVLVLITVGLFLVGSRDSDAGAVVRRQVDERQAHQRLHVQALVGQVLSVAVAIGYLVAVATKAALWPFGSLLGVVAVTFAAGWWIHGEHRPRSGDSADAPRSTSPHTITDPRGGPHE